MDYIITALISYLFGSIPFGYIFIKIFLKKDIREMTECINAKTLKFLSLDGLYKALTGSKRNDNYPQFSDHYFTGDYPIKPADNLKGLKVKQLSLLSGKSNS